jgi:hypothetical protein
MARDKGLEEILSDDLRDESQVTEKAMFGGWAWLLNGHLLCGSRDDGMLVRLGKDQDAWALKIPGVMPMISRERRMHGWVKVSSEVYGDDSQRKKLLTSALKFVRTLPPK